MSCFFILLIILFENTNLLYCVTPTNYEQLDNKYFNINELQIVIPKIDVLKRIDELNNIDNPTVDELVELVDLLILNGQLELAKQKTEVLFSYMLPPPEAFYFKAYFAFSEGDFIESTKIINEGLLHYTNYPTLIELKASIEYYEQGINAYIKATEIINKRRENNLSKNVLFLLNAYKSLSSGYYSEAYNYATESLNFVEKPYQKIKVYLLIANIMSQAMSLNNLELLTKELSSNIQGVIYINILKIQILYSKHKYHDAIELLDKLEHVNPNNVEVLWLAAKIMLKEQKTNKAKEKILTILNISPNSPSATILNIFLKAYESYNDKDIEKIAGILKQYPYNIYGWQLLTFLYIQNQNYEKAEDCISKINSINPRDYISLCYLAFINLNTYRWETSQELAMLLIKIFPETDLPYIYAINACINLGRLEEADNIYNKAIQQNVSSPDIFWVKGYLEIEKNNVKSAKDYFKRAISNKPKKEYLYSLGFLYIQHRLWDKALVLFKKVKETPPIMYSDDYFLYKIYQVLKDEKNKRIHKKLFRGRYEIYESYLEAQWDLLSHMANGVVTWKTPFIVQNAYLKVQSNISKDFTKQIYNTLEKIDFYFKDKLIRNTLKPKYKYMNLFTMTVYKTEPEYMHRRFIEHGKWGEGGHYLKKKNEGITWYKGDSETLGSASHEFTHHLIYEYFDLTPKWFKEGLAEVTKVYIEPKEKVRLLAILNEVDNSAWPGLKEFISQYPREKDRNFYALSWKLVDTLLKEKYKVKWEMFINRLSSHYEKSSFFEVVKEGFKGETDESISWLIFYEIFKEEIDSINKDWTDLAS